MPTPRQLQLIHVAAREVALEKPQYRMLLRNVAGVDSSKDLSNETFEDVMAVLEDLGFRGPGTDSLYWRNKVRLRGVEAGPRMVHKIRQLAANSRYALPALCLRFSAHRTDEVDRLHPREAWKLIEMLKAAGAREQQTAAAASPADDQGGADDVPF